MTTWPTTPQPGGIAWWGERLIEAPEGDTVGITDSITIARENVVTDPVGISDSISLSRGMGAITDPVGITDSISAVFGAQYAPNINDSLGITDSLSLSRGTVISDPVGITDSLSVVLTPGGVSIKGTPNSSLTTSVAIPTHAVGDLIVIFAWQYNAGSGVVPTAPAASGTVPAWVIQTNTAATSNFSSCVVATFVATATNHTSGTWNFNGATTTAMFAVVISGADVYKPVGGQAVSTVSSATTTAPAITQINTSGSSLLLHFLGQVGATAFGAAPAGYTKQLDAAPISFLTKNSSTTDGAVTLTNTGGGTSYSCASVEILAARPKIKGINTSTTTSVTIPAHNAGDLIVLYALDNANTAPAKPAAGGTVPAWATIDNPAGASGAASGTFQFTATTNNHTSGTWSNTAGMAAVVISGQGSTPIGGHAESGSTGIGAAIAPTMTLTNTDATSVVLHFFGVISSSAITWSAPPAGYTQQKASGTNPTPICVDTKDDSTSVASVTQGDSSGTNLAYRGATVEIRQH